MQSQTAMVPWPSGEATVCKTVYSSSILLGTSKRRRIRAGAFHVYTHHRPVIAPPHHSATSSPEACLGEVHRAAHRARAIRISPRQASRLHVAVRFGGEAAAERRGSARPSALDPEAEAELPPATAALPATAGRGAVRWRGGSRAARQRPIRCGVKKTGRFWRPALLCIRVGISRGIWR